MKKIFIIISVSTFFISCKNQKLSKIGNSSAFESFQKEITLPPSSSAPSSPSDNSGHGSSAPRTETTQPDSSSSLSMPFVRGAETTNTTSLKINKNGVLEGKDVINQEAKGFQSTKPFTGGSPKGIILHKTAGNTCGSNNSIPPKLRGPHIFICKSGKIIVTGSFDYPRTFSEKGHNDWSLNIEFESPYEDNNRAKAKAICNARGELTLGGYGNCYEPLNDKQIAAGRNVIDLLSKRYSIPKQLPLPASNQEQYTSSSTSIVPQGVRTKGTALNKAIDQIPKGILPSFWTVQYNGDKDNHDDGPSWNELKKLGIVQ